MSGSIFAGRYRLIESLGRGSNGIVWRAHDANHNREVALKRFAPGVPNILAYDEASLLTELESDHILRVYNADTFADVPYIATRVAATTTEAQLATSRAGIAADTVLGWSRHLLVGLRSAHEVHLVHCDIKPANIFLDSHGRALLGDFGLARRFDGTGAVAALGTPRVRSPEMFAAGTASVRSDIYAVGVSMYRLLTGQWPFATEAQVMAGQYPRIRALAPHVPGRLAIRIERALSRDRADRFSSAAEMNSALGVADLLPRIWEPLPSHLGHVRCWVEKRSSGTGLDVCVSVSADRYQIEVRRGTPSRPRVVALCSAAVLPRDLEKTLRRTFDAALQA